MAYFGITATEAGLRAATPGEDLRTGLARCLVEAEGRPIVILLHGYKFHPDRPDADPHRSLFALRPRA